MALATSDNLNPSYLLVAPIGQGLGAIQQRKKPNGANPFPPTRLGTAGGSRTPDNPYLVSEVAAATTGSISNPHACRLLVTRYIHRYCATCPQFNTVSGGIRFHQHGWRLCRAGRFWNVFHHFAYRLPQSPCVLLLRLHKCHLNTCNQWRTICTRDFLLCAFPVLLWKPCSH